MNKNLLTSLSVIGVLLLLYGLFIAISTNSNKAVNAANSTQPLVPVQQHISQVPIPESMAFAGEAVPLYDYQAKESLDRELTAITFRHSTTARVLKLSNRWFPTIERILAANGIPDDFKYLAVAESGLSNAISPKNAVGFWQILADTGREMGLEIGSDVDERYHVEKATLTACKYFNKAYKKFGNWTMAAASYNRGMKGMSGHISDQQQDSYYNLYLNDETARYIFRIIAFKQLMSFPDQYGYHFERKDLYPDFAHNTVNVRSIPNIANFAQQHNTTYKKIKTLNPWLRRASLSSKSGKEYTIKLPM